MLDNEFEFFLANHQELINRYEGKILAILGKEIVGVFESTIEAYKRLRVEYPGKDFLIQRCSQALFMRHQIL